ncbi:MAG: hypothetical protein J1F39_00015 [Clostridiales bacterium]|nr:hypothetical protein [Clostridiales bacterium]
MSVKIFVAFLCAAIGTGLGFTVSRLYAKTSKYYLSVLELITELKRNIAYRRDSVASVMKGFKAGSERLGTQIAEYLAFVSTKNGELKLSRGFLSSSSFSDIVGFFSSLGRADGDGQEKDLDMYYKKFEADYAAATEKSKKYGPLAIKLGFLFGLCLGILFL